jgi:hypothetical protein
MTMKDKVNHPAPDTAADLTSLADWITEQLDDETTDRQWIAETAAAKIRDITLQMPGAAEVTQPTVSGMPAPLPPGWRPTVRQALKDAIGYCEIKAGGADGEFTEQIGLYRSLAGHLGIELGR